MIIHYNNANITHLTFPISTPTGNASSSDSSSLLVAVAAVIVVITFVGLFGFIAYKSKKKLNMYKAARNAANTEKVKKLMTPSSLMDHDNYYATIGKERPSTCEKISHHEQTDMADGYVLPSINEECNSVFAESVTEAEMLESITGHNSSKRSSEFVADSGLYSAKDYNHTDNTIPHEQDHCTSLINKHLVHKFDNDSVLSMSSSNSDDEEETTLHPDYYTTAQRTTISQLTSGCGSEAGHCFDVIKHKDVESEDSSVADND
ncbi:uncharacterized protein [Dysidea avara]|uniref:uncharacterized protein isoform X2 n=1 Tax=Dysidea avara TaxID=196820 RepID=UPI003332C868